MQFHTCIRITCRYSGKYPNFNSCLCSLVEFCYLPYPTFPLHLCQALFLQFPMTKLNWPNRFSTFPTRNNLASSLAPRTMFLDPRAQNLSTVQPIQVFPITLKNNHPLLFFPKRSSPISSTFPPYILPSWTLTPW